MVEMLFKLLCSRYISGAPSYEYKLEKNESALKSAFFICFLYRVNVIQLLNLNKFIIE